MNNKTSAPAPRPDTGQKSHMQKIPTLPETDDQSQNRSMRHFNPEFRTVCSNPLKTRLMILNKYTVLTFKNN